MRRWLTVSLVLHLLVVASLALTAGPVPLPPPVAVYTVQLVGTPGPPRPAPAKAPTPAPAPTPPKARSGVQTKTAPSVERTAPKGGRKPAPDTAKPAPASPAVGTARTATPAGLRLDGPAFPFPEYLGDLVARVQAQWRPPIVPAGVEPRATVLFRIGRDGRLLDVRLEKGSGLRDFDRLAVAAVRAAAPLPALPEGFRSAELGVHLDFSP